MITVERWMKRCFALLLTLLLCLGVLPCAAALTEYRGQNYIMEILPDEDAEGHGSIPKEPSHDASWYTEAAVYERMMAMKSSYPEGMRWTNDNSYDNVYQWNDPTWYTGRIHYTGYGCAGFALLMSDAGFGVEMPYWTDHDVTFSKVRVGDILRINNNSHSVIVLKVNSDSVTIAEGNYNSSIHWGRTLSAAQVDNADYILSRWPGVPAAKAYTIAYDANGGSGAPQAQSKTEGEPLTLSSVRPVRSGWFFVGWAESSTATSPDYQPGDAYITDEDATLCAVWKAPDLVLPASATTIEAEAFTGGAFSFVKLSDQTASVGSRAFANCANLSYIYIPAAATDIDPDAFGAATALTVFGQAGSSAESFASANGFAFIPVEP